MNAETGPSRGPLPLWPLHIGAIWASRPFAIRPWRPRARPSVVTTGGTTNGTRTAKVVVGTPAADGTLRVDVVAQGGDQSGAPSRR